MSVEEKRTIVLKSLSALLRYRQERVAFLRWLRDPHGFYFKKPGIDVSKQDFVAAFIPFIKNLFEVATSSVTGENGTSNAQTAKNRQSNSGKNDSNTPQSNYEDDFPCLGTSKTARAAEIKRITPTTIQASTQDNKSQIGERRFCRVTPTEEPNSRVSERELLKSLRGPRGPEGVLSLLEDQLSVSDFTPSQYRFQEDWLFLAELYYIIISLNLTPSILGEVKYLCCLVMNQSVLQTPTEKLNQLLGPHLKDCMPPITGQFLSDFARFVLASTPVIILALLDTELLEGLVNSGKHWVHDYTGFIELLTSLREFKNSSPLSIPCKDLEHEIMGVCEPNMENPKYTKQKTIFSLAQEHWMKSDSADYTSEATINEKIKTILEMDSSPTFLKFLAEYIELKFMESVQSSMKLEGLTLVDGNIMGDASFENWFHSISADDEKITQRNSLGNIPCAELFFYKVFKALKSYEIVIDNLIYNLFKRIRSMCGAYLCEGQRKAVSLGVCNFLVTTKKLRSIAKYLGYIFFNSQNNVRIDLFSILEGAINGHSLIIAVPCLCAFLSMSVDVYSESHIFSSLLSSLMSLYISANNLFTECTNAMMPLDCFEVSKLLTDFDKKLELRVFLSGSLKCVTIGSTNCMYLMLSICELFSTSMFTGNAFYGLYFVTTRMLNQCSNSVSGLQSVSKYDTDAVDENKFILFNMVALVFSHFIKDRGGIPIKEECARRSLPTKSSTTLVPGETQDELHNQFFIRYPEFGAVSNFILTQLFKCTQAVLIDKLKDFYIYAFESCLDGVHHSKSSQGKEAKIETIIDNKKKELNKCCSTIIADIANKNIPNTFDASLVGNHSLSLKELAVKITQKKFVTRISSWLFKELEDKVKLLMDELLHPKQRHSADNFLFRYRKREEESQYPPLDADSIDRFLTVLYDLKFSNEIIYTPNSFLAVLDDSLLKRDLSNLGPKIIYGIYLGSWDLALTAITCQPKLMTGLLIQRFIDFWKHFPQGKLEMKILCPRNIRMATINVNLLAEVSSSYAHLIQKLLKSGLLSASDFSEISLAVFRHDWSPVELQFIEHVTSDVNLVYDSTDADSTDSLVLSFVADISKELQ